MSKQDRQGVRRASDLEQKYSFGEIGEAQKRSGQAELQVSRLEQQMNQFMSSVNTAIATLSSRVEAIYPVGSIYISVNDTNPAGLFGGVWSRVEDRFLLAAGSEYTAGATGGEATHKLTVDEIPAHSHSVKVSGTALATGGDSFDIPDAAGSGVTGVIANTGGGKAHNNMPPYLAVYVWKRVS